MNEDEAIRQFRGERPGTSELREWRTTLERRLQAFERDRKKATPGTAALDSKIAQLKRQIAALREEEAITEFVEDSVRVTLAMGAAAEEIQDLEG